MYTYPIHEFKSKFSTVQKILERGESVVITKGRNKTILGTLVPPKKNKVKFGLLKNAKVTFAKDFKMTTEELLNL